MKKKSAVTALILVFVPVVLCFVFEIISAFAYFAIIFMEKAFAPDMITATQTASDAAVEEFLTNGANSGLYYILKFLLFLIIFGWWYHEAFANPAKPDYVGTKEKPVAKLFNPGNVVALLMLACSIQLFVDGVISLLSILAPDLIANYSSIISNLTGKGTTISVIIAVVILAPIAEEVCFRGLTLKYAQEFARRSNPNLKRGALIIPIVLQAVIFGLYHGNLIQGTYAFLSALLFGAIAVKTNSLIPGIILHAFINASAYLVPSTLFDTATRSTITTVVSLLAATGMVWLLNRNYNNAVDESEEENE